MTSAEPRVPELQPCGMLVVDVGAPLDLVGVGAAERRAVPVLGGTLSGEIGRGVILGGWDWQTVLPDGSLLIDATYPVRLENDDVVSVNTVGVRHAIADEMQPYFRLAVTITGDQDVISPTRQLLVASGVRQASTVTLQIYRVT